MIAAGLAAALVLAGGTVAAEPVAIVARAPADAPVPPQRVAAALARAARGAGATAVVDGFERARSRLDQGAVPAGRLAGFVQASTLARAGWHAYLAAEPERAAEALARAREAALAVLDLQGGVALYADIVLRLGVVLHQLGRVDEAAGALRLAAVLDPVRVVSVAEFAPDAVAAYEAARRVSAPDASVGIEVRPAGAMIEIDGRPAGAAPVRVPLPVGQHVVVARAPGYRGSGRVVAVAPGQAAVVIGLERDPPAAAMVRGPDALAVGGSAEEAGGAVQGLARYAEVDAVILVASVWRRGGPALLGQRCHAGEDVAVACTSVVELGYDSADRVDAAAAGLWAALAEGDRRGPPTLLADPRLVEAEPRPRPPVAARRGCAWCGRPWLWVGVGAAVVAAGTVWALSRDGEVSTVVTVEPCMFGGCGP